MFGDDILVAPIVTPTGKDGKATRRTWLPEGKWFDVCRNQVMEGNKVVSDAYTQEEIPYFYKAGAVIVNYPPMLNLNTRPDRIIIKVVPGAEGAATFYEDEGDTEGYKKGEFTNTVMRHAGDQLTISPRTGAFPGMLASRAYTVEFLCSERPSAVKVNGQAVTNGAWNYNTQSKVTTVFVPSIDCSKEITVKLEQ